jgi:hypothetical protein
MIHTLNRPNRFYRRLSKVTGFRIAALRTTSKAIGPVMNAELADVHAANRARKSAEVSK